MHHHPGGNAHATCVDLHISERGGSEEGGQRTQALASASADCDRCDARHACACADARLGVSPLRTCLAGPKPKPRRKAWWLSTSCGQGGQRSMPRGAQPPPSPAPAVRLCPRLLFAAGRPLAPTCCHTQLPIRKQQTSHRGIATTAQTPLTQIACTLRAMALRQAASTLRRQLGSPMSQQAAQQQQRRGAHELSAKKNKFIEDWLSRREDIDQEFTWSNANLIWVLVLGVGVPVGTYNALVSEMQQEDEYAGRPVRSFLWNHAPTKPAAKAAES